MPRVSSRDAQCFAVVVSLSSSIFAACAPAQPAARNLQSPPELILFGGKVFTADSTQPWAEAVAIRDGRIQIVSSNEAVLATAGPATRRIDVAGRVVIPGFNDAHDHPLFAPPVGIAFRTAAVPAPNPEFAQVLDSIRALVGRTPTGTWLRTEIGPRIARDTIDFRSALDAVAVDHPVLLWGWWGHGTIVNSAALRALAITDDVQDPIGGWYERAPTGRLNGVLQEYAAWAALRKLYTAAPESTLITALHDYAAQRLRKGVTSVQYMTTFPDPRTLQRLLQSAALPIRMRLVRWPIPDSTGIAGGSHFSPRSSFGASTVPSGIKWVVDGTPIEQLAFRRTPYPNRSGWHGRLNLPIDTIRAILTQALATKEPLLLHIVGDSATALVLTLMERVGTEAQWQPLRVRIEHGNGIARSDIARVRRLGIVIAQPRVGSPLRTWLAAGIPLAYGSDTSPNPFADFAAMTTAPNNPAEAISREDAVIMYTRGGAFAEFAERAKGTLAPGMDADLAVLSIDIFTVADEELATAASVLTLVGGKIVHDSGVLPMPRE